MIKILHFSDTHFDRPFELVTPEAFSSRYAELKNSFSSVMKYINANEIDICLIPGDLFDAETLSSDTLAFIKREFESCPKCKFFITPGDADAYTPSSPYNGNWPANVHIFTEEKLCRVHLDELNCDIYGAAVTKNTTAANPMESVEPFTVNRTNLLVIHGETDTTRDGVYNLPAQLLRESGFDYIALGHHHDATNPAYVANYAYSGTLMGHGFHECGNKGALLVTAEGTGITVKDVKFSSHSYIKLAVDISSVEHYGNTNEAIARIIDAKIAEVLGHRTRIESISVMVTLTGHTDEHLQFSLNSIRKLVENATDPVIRDETVILPRSPLLGGVKAGIEEEARQRMCPELSERALKLVTGCMKSRERK
ncbi:MAG: hypothetical protein E7588_05050 [Ruminococcaceae bacterium]|nr:hypothetical protein [Oscillospiraceae bacterium]